MSVATAVGFIALAGVSAEFGVIMLLYLKHAWERRLAAGEPADVATLVAAIREGAVQRVRPKAMTVAVILAGLLPIMLGHGTGSEIMQRIAAPMVGRNDHGSVVVHARDSGDLQTASWARPTQAGAGRISSSLAP